MNGFTISVYFKDPPDINGIVELIKAKGEILEMNLDPRDFTINFRVENIPNQDRYYRIYSGMDEEFDAPEILLFKDQLGFIPKIYLAFMVWPDSSMFDEIFIGKLITETLSISDGFVEFQDVINKDLIESIEGEIFEIEHISGNASSYKYNIIDKTFLENWLKHSAFYLPH
jgi:hypothetical protein